MSGKENLTRQIPDTNQLDLYEE